MTAAAGSLFAAWPAADAAASCPGGWHWFPCSKKSSVQDQRGSGNLDSGGHDFEMIAVIVHAPVCPMVMWQIYWKTRKVPI